MSRTRAPFLLLIRGPFRFIRLKQSQRPFQVDGLHLPCRAPGVAVQVDAASAPGVDPWGRPGVTSTYRLVPWQDH